MSDRDKTNYLYQLLFERYRSNNQWAEWAVFAELMEAPAGGQRIDFFAVHTWRSKKYKAIAHEVKVSRGDFFKEIRNPDKSRFAHSVSNESYIVTPALLVHTDEVPDPWGLITVQPGSRTLRIVKKAEYRDKIHWPMHFMVSIARRATDKLPVQVPLLEIEVDGIATTDMTFA